MVKNGIKTRREAVGIRQAELAAQLRDVTAAAVLSGIESGYAMPTRTDMGILCEVLRCAPEDLYDAEALDLTGRNASSAKSGKRRNNTEIRVRIDPQDKRELTEAVAYLGYRDLSEWLQRMAKGWPRACGKACGRLKRLYTALAQATKMPGTMRQHRTPGKPITARPL